MASDRTWISVWIRCAVGGFVALRFAIGEIDCDFLGPRIEHNTVNPGSGTRRLVLPGNSGRAAQAQGRQDKCGNQQDEKSWFATNISDREEIGPFVFAGAHGLWTQNNSQNAPEL